MRRIAATGLASVLLITCVSGCSFFGWGKKDKAADAAYDPTYNGGYAGGGVTDPYTAGTGSTSYPVDSYETAGTSGGRYHTVQRKETLYSISRQYYGDHGKWKDIYAANRSEISDPNKIRVGQRLMIP